LYVSLNNPQQPEREPASSGQDEKVPADILKTNLIFSVPPDDRKWSAQDFVAAVEALEDIARKDYRRLPRFNAGTWKDTYFARLTAEEDLLLDKNSRMEQWMKDGVARWDAMKRLLAVYLRASLADRSFNTEYLIVLSHGIKVALAQIRVGKEFFKALSAEEQKNPVRLLGLAQMKRGLANSVRAVVLSLADRNYALTDRARLAQVLDDTAERLRLDLPSEYLPDLVKDLRTIRELEEDKALVERLNRVLRALSRP
jgi:hypothetical protein